MTHVQRNIAGCVYNIAGFSSYIAWSSAGQGLIKSIFQVTYNVSIYIKYININQNNSLFNIEFHELDVMLLLKSPCPALDHAILELKPAILKTQPAILRCTCVT